MPIGAGEAAETLRVPLKVVEDADGPARAAYEARLVLVRPDQYVVWAGDAAPGDARALLRERLGGAP